MTTTDPAGDDPASIPPNRRTGTDIDIFSDNHIPGNGRLWVDEGAFVDDRAVVVKFVNHGCKIIRGLVD